LKVLELRSGKRMEAGAFLRGVLRVKSGEILRKA
jgi:hypothetical protein